MGGRRRSGKEEKREDSVEAVSSGSSHSTCEGSANWACEGSVSQVFHEVCKGFTFKGVQRLGCLWRRPLKAAVGSGCRGAELFGRRLFGREKKFGFAE